MATSRQGSTQAVDVVALLRMSDMTQVVRLARPLAATVYEVAQTAEHPIENGSVTTDNIIFLPVEIDMPLILTGDDMAQTFDNLRQIYRTGTLLSVLTRAAIYPSMLIAEMPHDETAEMIDGLSIGLKLREAQFVEPAYGGLTPAQVKKPAQASTVKKGAQQTQPASAPATAKAQEQYRGSTLYRITR